MKSVCVLLNGDIRNDSRVIKTIQTISTYCTIDLFYVSEDVEPCPNRFNENVRLFRCEYRNKIKTKIIRHSFFYNEFLFFIKEIAGAKTHYDYIYANDLPCLKPAVKLKRKLDAKLIYDAHEIYTETLNQFFPQNSKGLRKFVFNFLLKLMRYFGTKTERRYVKKVDYFITVGEGLRNYFQRKYHVFDVKIMMNCPKLQSERSTKSIKKLLDLKEDVRIFLYQGNFNSGRGLKLLIQSFLFVEEGNVLVLLGDGMLKSELKNEVLINKLEGKVFFIDTVRIEELLAYTSCAHCGFNLLEPLNLSKSLAAPNKLFEYLHAGIPVIASYSYENNIVFSKYNIGLRVNNTPSEIAQAINTIAKTNKTEYSENCKIASMEYCWENQEQVLKEILS